MTVTIILFGTGSYSGSPDLGREMCEAVLFAWPDRYDQRKIEVIHSDEPAPTGHRDVLARIDGIDGMSPTDGRWTIEEKRNLASVGLWILHKHLKARLDVGSIACHVTGDHSVDASDTRICRNVQDAA